jgi:hypothetical protein
MSAAMIAPRYERAAALADMRRLLSIVPEWVVDVSGERHAWILPLPIPRRKENSADFRSFSER